MVDKATLDRRSLQVLGLIRDGEPMYYISYKLGLGYWTVREAILDLKKSGFIVGQGIGSGCQAVYSLTPDGEEFLRINNMFCLLWLFSQ